MRYFLNLVLIAAILVPASVLALEEPTPSVADSRVRYVTYDEWQVVRIIGTIRTTVQIILAPNEEISWVAGGDTLAWETEPRGNILFLKARELNPPSNLQVVATRSDGSLRTYTFELITRDGNIMNGVKDVYFTIKFKYPRDEANARRAAAALERKAASERVALDRLVNSARRNGAKNWKYLGSGPRQLEPVEIFDNGQITVIKLKHRTRMPSVYLVNEAGDERVASTSIRGDEIFVHGVYGEIRLRLGRQVFTLYNMGLGDGHNNTGTSTVSAGVQREVIGE